MQILTELESNPNLCQFGYYYGKSVLHFLDSPPSPPAGLANKDLNVALFYALIEWLCYPRNARTKQN